MADDELTIEERDLLERLLRARGPSGDEKEVREVCRDALTPVCDEVWQDAAGNLVGLLRSADGEANPIQIVSHMDEIAMIVKRVEPDGTLTVTNLGGDRPISFGQCAADILADHGPIMGVLSLGSLHRSPNTHVMTEIRERGVNWELVYVITGRTRDELDELGVHPGTRVVVSTVQRPLVEMGELLAAHFMDDRALVLAGVMAMRRLRAERARLKRDVYYVCATKEETTNAGALYAAHSLPGEQMIALEVGPVASEYGTVLSECPILAYGDEKGHYSPELIEALRAACRKEGVRPQLALLVEFASDASAAIASGLRPQTAVMCIPTQNTHGFEVIHRRAIPVYARVLTRFLLS